MSDSKVHPASTERKIIEKKTFELRTSGGSITKGSRLPDFHVKVCKLCSYKNNLKLFSTVTRIIHLKSLYVCFKQVTIKKHPNQLQARNILISLIKSYFNLQARFSAPAERQSSLSFATCLMALTQQNNDTFFLRSSNTKR